MKYALAIAEMPKTTNTDANKRNWRDFLFRIQNDAKRPKDTFLLSEGVWQLPLDTELPALGHLIQMAQDDGISIRILFLDDAPAWITHPPAN